MIKLNNEKIEFTNFPNGETKLIESSLKVLTNNIIQFKYEGDDDLIKLMFVKKYLESIHIKEIKLAIMYMPYSRMDRSENGSAFTLKYVSEFINSLNFEEVMLIEPHSDVSVALLNNAKANYINFDLLPRVLKKVNFDYEHDYIMFPDAGASKRYGKMKIKNVIVGNKVRNFETGDIKELELHGNFETGGKKVVIVDDLSSYGGTFVKSAEALRRRGIEEVYLLVAHAENSVFKGKLFDHIDHLFTTDSIMSEENHWENVKYKNKITIINIEKVVI
ncbi:phosphoribosyltransferase family protein [Paenibacillus medicaginis]|uniref:Phosphoribosyltransferase family protein n=1 Tax=Paenibacillus medicaginis TaxID=1470560 RepID=A0ABV5BX66_9BACL